MGEPKLPGLVLVTLLLAWNPDSPRFVVKLVVGGKWMAMNNALVS